MKYRDKTAVLVSPKAEQNHFFGGHPLGHQNPKWELDAYGICHRAGDLAGGAAAPEVSGERFAFCRHSLHGGHHQAGGLRLAQVV